MWAWEFLRRNHAYQADCDSLKNFVGDVAGEKSRIADKYGLKRFKLYRESFSQNDRPRFVRATFSVRTNLLAEGEESRTIRLPIAPGDAVVRFSLQAMLDGSFSLNAQVREAKERLGKILKKLSDDYQPPPHRVVERVRLNKLIEYLKMLDHRSAGATQLDCDLLVNQAKKERLESPTEESTKEGERPNAKKKLSEAEYLTTHGYLDLAVRRGYPQGCPKNN